MPSLHLVHVQIFALPCRADIIDANTSQYENYLDLLMNKELRNHTQSCKYSLFHSRWVGGVKGWTLHVFSSRNGNGFWQLVFQCT